MTPDPGTVVTIVALAVAALVWLVRLEGRVNGHERELQDVKKGHDSDITGIRNDLQYIRDRIDRVLEKRA